MRRARAAAEPMVLVTLYGVEGSTPRLPGSQMLITPTCVTGHFSGHCVEDDLVRHAGAVLDSRAPQTIRYGRGSPWWDIRLTCGGGIDLFLEHVAPDDDALSHLLALADDRVPAIWRRDDTGHHCRAAERSAPSFALHEAPFGFERRFDPAYRLFVFGQDPIALALATLAGQAGIDTHLAVPFGPDAGPAIPQVHYHRQAAARLFGTFPPDPWTAVIAASHDADQADAVLKAALDHAPGYIGAVGATTRRDDQIGRLVADGIDAVRAADVRMPVGIAGLGKSPFEVAVSILADLMRARNRDFAARHGVTAAA